MKQNQPTAEPPPAGAVAIERNTAAARRFVERALGAGDTAAFGELVADDVVVHSGLKPTGPIRGKAEYARTLAETLGALSDWSAMAVDDVAATADGRVVVRFSVEATHTGPLWGVGPTGRRVRMREIHLMRFRDGRLVENWVGGLNPLDFEMLFAPAITAMLFGPPAAPGGG